MVLPRPSRTRPTNLPASSTIWSKHGSRLTTPSLRSLKFVITSVASENSNLRQSKWVTRSCRLMPKTQFLEREKDFGHKPPLQFNLALAGRCLRHYILPRHTQQAAQRFVIDSRQRNQNGGVTHVMLGDVINVRGFRHQFIALLKTHTDDDGTRFSRLVDGRARQQLSPNFQRGLAISGALLNLG